MPATVRVAEWALDLVSTAPLFRSQYNLIGSKYLGYLHGYFNGNLPSGCRYNAEREGNVGKWLRSKGNIPTEALVESIPFRETRHYVKRVWEPIKRTICCMIKKMTVRYSQTFNPLTT